MGPCSILHCVKHAPWCMAAGLWAVCACLFCLCVLSAELDVVTGVVASAGCFVCVAVVCVCACWKVFAHSPGGFGPQSGLHGGCGGGGGVCQQREGATRAPSGTVTGSASQWQPGRGRPHMGAPPPAPGNGLQLLRGHAAACADMRPRSNPSSPPPAAAGAGRGRCRAGTAPGQPQGQPAPPLPLAPQLLLLQAAGGLLQRQACTAGGRGAAVCSCHALPQ